MGTEAVLKATFLVVPHAKFREKRRTYDISSALATSKSQTLLSKKERVKLRMQT